MSAIKLFCLTAVFGVWLLPAAGASVEVRLIEGQGIFLRAGETSWQALQAGDILKLGDRVATGEGAVLQLATHAGVLELGGESTEFMVKALPSGQAAGALTLELSSGQFKADWAGSAETALNLRTPAGEVTIQKSFFSVWIYALLGKSYVRLDVFRGEAVLKELSHEKPLRLQAGQHVTSGLNSQQGPREEPFIPGFDAFEINPYAETISGKRAVVPAAQPDAAAAGALEPAK